MLGVAKLMYLSMSRHGDHPLVAETLYGMRWLVTWRARRVDPREKPLRLEGLSRELLPSRDKKCLEVEP